MLTKSIIKIKIKILKFFYLNNSKFISNIFPNMNLSFISITQLIDIFNNLQFSMRKTILEQKKPKNLKKKDKRPKNKYEANPFSGVRWSQGLNLLSPRLTSQNQQKHSSVFKNYSQRNLQKKCTEKIGTKKNQGRFSGTSSPQKTYFFQKTNQKFCTSNATPLRKSYQDEMQRKICNNLRKNFKFIYQIGFGGFGRVWKVQDRTIEKDFAMKQISKKKVLEKNSLDCIMNEKKVLTTLNNPFLINISRAFQDQHNLYLVMDYLRGADLRYHICYKEFFSESQTKFIVACIILAIEYIHHKKIIHRDIKPENLVFENNGYLRLTDFGVAIFCQNFNFSSKDSSGTPGYMAPQILFKKQYTYSSDFFAIGVIAYELLLGKRPYQGKCRKQIRQLMEEKQVQLSEQQVPHTWSLNALDFINKLILKDPEQRLGGKQGIKELKRHKWMKTIDWAKLQKKLLIPPFAPHVVCETKDYLDEIILYNEMKDEGEDENRCILPFEQKLFANYEYTADKADEGKKTKKLKRTSQEKLL